MKGNPIKAYYPGNESGRMPSDKFLQRLIVQGDRIAASLAKGVVTL